MELDSYDHVNLAMSRCGSETPSSNTFRVPFERGDNTRADALGVVG